MSKRKNVSSKVPNGRTIQTRDEYFFGASNYQKKGYENRKLYRRAVVVDSNSRDELAVVKLHGNKGKILDSYQKGKSGYKPYIETQDNYGNPIKIDGNKEIKGVRFKENNVTRDLAPADVNVIRNDCYRYPKNIARIKALKKRKQKR